MELCLPKIELIDSEKIWMLHLWKKIKKNEKISYRSMRIALYNKLPVEFKPQQIDDRLVGFDGESITLLGVYLIDPAYNIIKKADLVLLSIKQLLLENTEIERIEAKTIAEIVKMTISDVGIILKLISPYGHFWSSATNNQEYFGYISISLSQENKVFDQYLSFTNAEELINKYYERKSNETNELPIYQFPSKAIVEKRRETIFGSRIEKVDLSLCFVLMPFKEEWSERIYRKYIRKNIEFMGLQCLRSDNLTGQIIIEDIWIKINQAAFIIADVTGRNPNVMYELGITHTLGKPFILITQELDKIPFDFTHLRHYAYEDNADGLEKFSLQLKKSVSDIYKECYPNYIHNLTNL